MGRAAVFVDGENLRKILQGFGLAPMDIDHERLGPVLCAEVDPEIDFLRTYWYDSPPHKSKQPDQTELELRRIKGEFFAYLRQLRRIELRNKGYCMRYFDEESKPVFVQKGVDTRLAIDLTRLSLTRQITHAIVVGSDGDLMPGVKSAKEEGIEVWVFHGPFSARSLRYAADETRLSWNNYVVDRVHPSVISRKTTHLQKKALST